MFEKIIQKIQKLNPKDYLEMKAAEWEEKLSCGYGDLTEKERMELGIKKEYDYDRGAEAITSVEPRNYEEFIYLEGDKIKNPSSGYLKKIVDEIPWQEDLREAKIKSGLNPDKSTREQVRYETKDEFVDRKTKDVLKRNGFRRLEDLENPDDSIIGRVSAENTKERIENLKYDDDRYYEWRELVRGTNELGTNYIE